MSRSPSIVVRGACSAPGAFRTGGKGHNQDSWIGTGSHEPGSIPFSTSRIRAPMSFANAASHRATPTSMALSFSVEPLVLSSAAASSCWWRTAAHTGLASQPTQGGPVSTWPD